MESPAHDSNTFDPPPEVNSPTPTARPNPPTGGALRVALAGLVLGSALGLQAAVPIALVVPPLLLASNLALAGIAIILALNYLWPAQDPSWQSALLALNLALWTTVMADRRRLCARPLPLTDPVILAYAKLYCYALGTLCFAALLFRSVPPYAAWSWGVVSLLIGRGLTPGKALRDLLPAPRAVFAALPIVITTLVLVEVGVRVAFPVRFTPTGLGRIHPENIWAPEPGIDAVISFAPAPNETGAFRVTLNSLGIRAEEPQPKLPGEYRILFAGDSYTMGWGLEQGKTYAALTDAELRRRFPEHNIRTINAGIAGYGPWQEFGVLQKVVPAYQPDLVILQTFSANDINDSLARRGKRMRAFLPEHELMVNTFRLRNRHWPWRCESWLFSHCRAYRVLRNSINMPLFIKLCRDLRVVPAFPTPRLPESEPRGWLYEVDLAQWYPELQEGWEMMQADIRAMRDYCAGRGIAFAAFNIPYPVDKGEAVRYLRHYTDPNEYAPDKNARITANFFRREGIPYFTPLQTFREHPNPYSLVYHADGHLTPEGAKVLTGDIVNFLLTKYPENAPWRNHPSPPPSSSPIPNS